VKHLSKNDYKIVGSEVQPANQDESGYSKMSKDDLISMAKKKNLNVPANATKADILALLSAGFAGR
jgi:hypothetical protein